MKLSISQRLATMFALASFVMLAVLGIAMHTLLSRELERHQINELQARFQMYKPVVLRNDDAEHWANVRAKFENALPENGRVRLFVFGNDPRFEFGPRMSGDQLRSSAHNGFGELVSDQAQAMKTYSEIVEAHGERPAVRLVVAIDTEP